MKVLKEFLLRDPLRKIIALGLTILLYAVLNEGKKQQKDISGVPLEIRCDDDVYLTSANRSAYFHLTLRGTESRIQKLNAMDIKGSLEVSRSTYGFDSGQVVLRLKPEDFTVPKGIEIVSIEPEILTLPVQQKISKNVPVKALMHGSPANGYATDGASCVPSTVMVSGPEREVNLINEIRTTSQEIRKERNSYTIEKASLINPRPSTLTFVPEKVSVRVSIIPNADHVIQNIPVRWITPPRKTLHFIPEKNNVSVTVSGLQDDIDNLKSDDIIVFADLNKFGDGEYTVTLQAAINSPETNLKIKQISPAAIRVKIDSSSKQ